MFEIVGLQSLPYVYAVMASVISWRSLTRRGLFFLVSMLSLIGISATTYSLMESWLVPSINCLPAVNSVANSERILSASLNALRISALLTTIFGLPLIYWIRRALQRPPAS